MNLVSAKMPNQLVQNGNFVNTSGWDIARSSTTFAINNNICTISYTDDAQGYGHALHRPLSAPIIGHKYYCSQEVKPSVDCIIGFDIFNIIVRDITCLANKWTLVNHIITSNQLWRHLYCVNSAQFISAGNTIQVKNVMVIDLTELYGQGLEPTIEQFKQDYPLDYYPYSATSYTGLLKQNGKLVSTDLGQMLPQGIGCVDLGTLNWAYNNGLLSSNAISDIKEIASSLDFPSILCPLYETNLAKYWYRKEIDKMITLCGQGYGTTKELGVYDTAYTDAQSFKTAMNGVLLFYKKAT